MVGVKLENIHIQNFTKGKLRVTVRVEYNIPLNPREHTKLNNSDIRMIDIQIFERRDEDD